MFTSILNMKLFKESDDFETGDDGMGDLNNELNSAQPEDTTDEPADDTVSNYSDEGDDEPLMGNDPDGFDESKEFGGDNGDDMDALNADLQSQENTMDIEPEDVNESEVENDNVSKTTNTVIEIHKSLVNMYQEYSDFVDGYKKLDINMTLKSKLETHIDNIIDLLETLKLYIQTSEDEPVLKIKKTVEFRCLFAHECNKIYEIAQG